MIVLRTTSANWEIKVRLKSTRPTGVSSKFIVEHETTHKQHTWTPLQESVNDDVLTAVFPKSSYFKANTYAILRIYYVVSDGGRPPVLTDVLVKRVKLHIVGTSSTSTHQPTSANYTERSQSSTENQYITL